MNTELIKDNIITRVEVIDNTGRAYVNWKDDNIVQIQLQDDGKTLKVFINKKNNKELNNE